MTLGAPSVKQSIAGTCEAVPNRRRRFGAAVVLAYLMGVLQACSSADATAPASALVRPADLSANTPRSARITRLGPDTLTAGGTLVIEGERLPVALADVRLTLGGVPLEVRAASPSRLEAAIPATAFACGDVARLPLQLTLGATRVDTPALLATATRLALAPGERAPQLAPEQARCLEFVANDPDTNPTATTARYVVALVNTHASQPASAELRGHGTGTAMGVVSTVIGSITTAPHLHPDPLPPASQQFSPNTHHTNLTTPHRQPPVWPLASQGLRTVKAPTNVGDTVSITALLNRCVTGHPVRARVVHLGSKIRILEDIKTPQTKQLADSYRSFGDEYDRTVHPLITANLGDPLALDAQMGGDGRITLLFTPFVNDSAPGTAAYVSACNFYPRATFAGSNQDEVIYARVATPHESAHDWRRALRSTVVHEAKHLASFAERLAHGHAFEEPWLEEATARVAEELYSRTFPGGGSWKGGAGFSGSVACELLQCDDRPLIMWKHFAGLYGYLQAADAVSPLGGPGGGTQATYSSGWALVRWAADRYASDEAAWLKELVRGGQGTGLQALAQATGRDPRDLVADWSLATALDDAAAADDTQGAHMARLQAATPSWRVADMMAGLARLYPGVFVARPLRVQRQGIGDFRLPVTALPGVASRYLTLDGSASAGQRLELVANEAPGAGPSSLRLIVARVR